MKYPQDAYGTTLCSDDKEYHRVRAWHVTFNAAVVGLSSAQPVLPSAIVEWAIRVANYAHGTLDTEPKT